MVDLSLIMIRIGCEFDIENSNFNQYGWNYVADSPRPAFRGSLQRFTLPFCSTSRRSH
jgi:hypothetical protein